MAALGALVSLTRRSRIGTAELPHRLLGVLVLDPRSAPRLAAAAGLVRIAPRLVGLTAIPYQEVLLAAAAAPAGGGEAGDDGEILTRACLPLLLVAARSGNWAGSPELEATLRGLLTDRGPAAAHGRRLAALVLAHMVSFPPLSPGELPSLSPPLSASCPPLSPISVSCPHSPFLCW